MNHKNNHWQRSISNLKAVARSSVLLDVSEVLPDAPRDYFSNLEMIW